MTSPSPGVLKSKYSLHYSLQGVLGCQFGQALPEILEVAMVGRQLAELLSKCSAAASQRQSAGKQNSSSPPPLLPFPSCALLLV